jgi:hypothetical protein
MLVNVKVRMVNISDKKIVFFKKPRMSYQTVIFRIKSIIDMHNNSLSNEKKPYMIEKYKEYILLWQTRLDWFMLQRKHVGWETVSSISYNIAIREILEHDSKTML